MGDYIDLVLFHAPHMKIVPFLKPPCGAEKSWVSCRSEAWLALSAFRTAGKVREMGVSNFNVAQMKSVEALGAAPIAANQFSWNPWTPQWTQDVFAYCQANNIAVTAYFSLGGSFQHAQTGTVQTLTEISTAKGKSTSQIL